MTSCSIEGEKCSASRREIGWLMPGVAPVWHYGYLFAPALTIGGGTWAVQRNIIAEWVLGLPRDPQ